MTAYQHIGPPYLHSRPAHDCPGCTPVGDPYRVTILIEESAQQALDEHLRTVYGGNVSRSQWIRDAIKAENALLKASPLMQSAARFTIHGIRDFEGAKS